MTPRSSCEWAESRLHRRHQCDHSLVAARPKTVAVMSGRNFALTFVTAAELLVGIRKAQEFGPAFRRVEPITRGRPIFYATEKTVSLYAELLCDLEEKGMRIPTNDIWIAAIALERELPLIARDAHFDRIGGLTMIAC